jgi:hypothetical protein
MHPNAELIRKFYTAFASRDARAMAACYHPSVRFSDEVFIDLQGARANAMWQMLCERGKDLKIEFRDRRSLRVRGREDHTTPRQLQLLGVGITGARPNRDAAWMGAVRKEARPLAGCEESRRVRARARLVGILPSEGSSRRSCRVF